MAIKEEKLIVLKCKRVEQWDGDECFRVFAVAAETKKLPRHEYDEAHNPSATLMYGGSLDYMRSFNNSEDCQFSCIKRD